MSIKSIQKDVQKFFKRNKQTVAKVMHYVPPQPLICLIFDVAMPQRLKKKNLKKYKGQKLDFQFAISGMPGVTKWTIEIDDGKAKMYRGELDIPSMVLNASARDFIDLATGYLSEAKATIGGRVGINGGPATQMKTVMDLMK